MARRIRALDAELAANHTALCEAVTAQAPQLLALPGVGAVVAATVLLAWSHPGRVRSEAAFAALAGASPLPASSGNTTRYRLNRGGDRRLNRVLNTVALVRMGHDPRTRDYVVRRTREGRTKREIMRSLKRYISRQLFRTLTAPTQPPAPLDNYRSISVLAASPQQERRGRQRPDRNQLYLNSNRTQPSQTPNPWPAPDPIRGSSNLIGVERVGRLLRLWGVEPRPKEWPLEESQVAEHESDFSSPLKVIMRQIDRGPAAAGSRFVVLVDLLPLED
ncbi:transposase [Micromonospora sp. NPDC047707]|uniref:transposase n=1 Tax=Micromonospora sp. NPDC047707 TaxID=3154498 RepID=UPI003453A67A